MANISGEDYYLKVLFEKTKIKDVMTTPVVTIHENDEVSEAQMKFVNNHISHLIVVNTENKLVGIISQKYLYKTQSPRKIISEEMDYDPDILFDGDNSFYSKDTLDRFILHSIMSKDPFSLSPEDSLAKGILSMAQKKISCIPIVDQNRRPQGVLSHQEIVIFAAKLLS